MILENVSATRGAKRSSSTPLVCTCRTMPRRRNRSAISNTSGRSSGSPPEKSTTRVPNSDRLAPTTAISSHERSPSPLAFHQSQDTQRLLHRLGGKKTASGSTNRRFVHWFNLTRGAWASTADPLFRRHSGRVPCEQGYERRRGLGRRALLRQAPHARREPRK